MKKEMFLISMIVGMMLYAPFSFSAPLMQISDQTDHHNPSTLANHTFTFTTTSGIDSPTDTITVTYASGFSCGSVTATSIDLLHGPTGTETDEVVTSSASAGVWGAAFSGGTLLTLTAPTDAGLTEIPGGEKITIKVGTHVSGGTHRCTNPSSIGSYVMGIAGTFGDSGFLAVPISNTLVGVTGSNPLASTPVATIHHGLGEHPGIPMQGGVGSFTNDIPEMMLDKSGKEVVKEGFYIYPGDLIKVSTQSTVYFYGYDKKRYVFPNQSTYQTWFADFDEVKLISREDVAKLPLAKNLVARPGSLVKIRTRPEVYGVGVGGLLQRIPDEETAFTLYGKDWNKKILDIPDVFWVNYHFGSDLLTSRHPDGTLVKYRLSSTIYVVKQGSLAPIQDEWTFYANYFSWPHIMEIPDSFEYPQTTMLSNAQWSLRQLYDK